MNDTQPMDAESASQQQTPPGEGGFEAQRLRSITDMQRSRSDALLGGVCTGAAKYLNVDPVVLRIGFAVLTLIGGAGLVLYLAAWFFLPSEDGAGTVSPSVAAEWFNLEDNEEKVRVGGMVVAAVVAVLSVIGDSGWGWGFPWWLFPIGILLLIFVVLPNRRRNRHDAQVARAQAMTTSTDYATALAQAKTDRILQGKLARAREPRSNALLGLTVSVAAIALAVTRLVADANGRTEWTTYVAVALAVVGLGLVVSTFFGHGGPLIPIGLLLAAVLAVGSCLPNLRIGQQHEQPDTAGAVKTSYEHGIGQFELDLTDVTNPQALLGRTVSIDSGVGQTRVILPDDLDVEIDSHLRAGEIRVFDRKVNGTDNELDVPADTARHLTIEIDHSLGNVEVIRR